MTKARITLAFLVEDFDEFVNDWLTNDTTVQDAANLAMGYLLVEEGVFGLIHMGIEPLDWAIEYPAQEGTE